MNRNPLFPFFGGVFVFFIGLLAIMMSHGPLLFVTVYVVLWAIAMVLYGGIHFFRTHLH